MIAAPSRGGSLYFAGKARRAVLYRRPPVRYHDRMKFHVITFGCQMNVADSGWLTRSLISMGWEEAPLDEARVYIVNTCSVREKPELKLYSQLGRLAEQLERDPEAFVAVGGCVAQQLGAKLWNRFRMVRLVFGSDGVAGAPAALARLAAEPGLRLSLVDFTEHYPERDPAYPEDALPAQAFVNIMQGCDNFCTYCIVPFVRGRQKSRQCEAVLAECRNLAERGVSEITLLGQNVNSYGLDAQGDGTSFAALLRKVAEIPGVRRIRFTTSHPKDLADEVIALYHDLPQLAPSLHLPVQSGSDGILKRMGRRYDAARYLDLIAKLRAANPDIFLTTDLIVGFPGETEEDFQRTMDLVEKAEFDSGFSFMYCDRPGVAAERMEGKVPLEVKSERLARLQTLLDALKDRDLASRIGRETEVIVEGRSKMPASGKTSWRGRDPSGRVVNFQHPGPEDLTGRYVTVKILKAKKHSLWGKADERHD